VLNIFAFAKDPNTRTSSFFGGLETLVVIAVIVAIACEVIVLIYRLNSMLKILINKFFKKVEKKVEMNQTELEAFMQKELEIKEEPFI
jgi:hypothetical protein